MLSGPVLAVLGLVEAQLVSAGFPAMSPWWRSTLAGFLRGGRRTLVARVGRRGGKSSTLCRLAVAVALSDEWSVPPGDVGVVAFVSISRDEAAQRLRTIAAILTALRVPFDQRGDAIELRDRPAVFKVFTATIAGVSGFTSILIVGDEVAKWRSADDSANPAREVVGSLAPTMATQPAARMVLSSSPLGAVDYHAERFDLGDTPEQQVASAPTWIANPAITEAGTHDLEPDPRVWSREYAAQPQAGVLSAFDAASIDAAFTCGPLGRPHQRLMVIDASSGRKDSWTWATCGWSERPGAARVLAFDVIDGISAKQWGQLSGADVVRRAAEVAHARGVRAVVGDQRESLMLRSEFQRHGLRFHAIDWTSASKPVGVERVRRLLQDQMLALPEHDALRRELLSFEERITPSGAFTFGARGSGHDDYVSLLITAALADSEGRLPGSPLRGGDAVIDRVLAARQKGERTVPKDSARIVTVAGAETDTFGDTQAVSFVAGWDGVHVVKGKRSPWAARAAAWRSSGGNHNEVRTKLGGMF